MKRSTLLGIFLVLVVGIFLVLPLPQKADEEPEEHWDLIPQVMVDGTLYFTTGYTASPLDRSDTPDGTITSSVEGYEQPTQNDQSNFGAGYSYQYGKTDGTIEINIDGQWWIYATEEVRDQIQFPD